MDKAQARIEAAAPYLAEDSVYKAGVRNLALEVLAGKVDAIALQAAVSVLDSQKESEKEIAAKEETKEQGETPPEPPKSEGEFDAAAFDAEVAAYRKSRGLEV
jgi:hypothetical protein